MNTENKFNLPLHSRVWIYQSSRAFLPSEIENLTKMVNEFLLQWNSHGKELTGEIRLLHNIFLVIALDEEKAMASGCSIDKSVRLVKDIENTFSLSLTGRTNVAYFDGDKNIVFKNFAELKKEIQNGKINDSILIFNNLLSTLGDMENNWIIPAKNSWLMDVRI